MLYDAIVFMSYRAVKGEYSTGKEFYYKPADGEY
jgi:hypothetical protein